MEVIDEEEEPKGDDKFILETFVDEKDMNLSKTDRTRSFTKEEEMLKNVSVIKKKENAKGKEKERRKTKMTKRKKKKLWKMRLNLKGKLRKGLRKYMGLKK